MLRLSTLASLHRALTVPEFLIQYFEKLDNHALAVAAVVCRLWSPLALDVLLRTEHIPLSCILHRMTFLRKEGHVWHGVSTLTRSFGNLRYAKDR